MGKSDATKKFFALRDSGYTGPIDQNGDKAEDTDAATILADMAKRT